MTTPQILRPLAAVITELQAQCRPISPQSMAIEEAVGHVLAVDLVVPGAVPPKPVALRSGYAVNSSDLVGVSAYSPLPLPQPLLAVSAGDPLPDGRDAVLPPDTIQTSGPLTEIVATTAPGENVRRAGEDAQAGALLLSAGATLRPHDVAMASAAGIFNAVVRQAFINLIADDDQLTVEAIVSTGLSGARVQAEQEDVDTVLARCIGAKGPDVDMVVVVTNVPDRALGHATGVVAHGLALRPGEMTQVGLVGSTPLVIVPARPDALFAVTRCLLAPLVAAMTLQRPRQSDMRAPLSRKLSSSIGLTEVALLQNESGCLEPLGIGTLSLPALAKADAWLAVPPESEGCGEGEVVEAFAIRP